MSWKQYLGRWLASKMINGGLTLWLASNKDLDKAVRPPTSTDHLDGRPPDGEQYVGVKKEIKF